MKILCCALVIIMALGCNQGKPSSGEYNTEQGLNLIDKGDYNGAIYLLSEQLTNFPDDPKTRALLASAYAARGGIILVNFGGFARALVDMSNRNKGPKVERTPIQQLDWEVGLIFMVLNTVPNIPPPGVPDILRAIYVLDAPNLSPGGYLYRALLKLTVFKFKFNTDYRLTPTANCQIKPQSLDNWLIHMDADLQNMMNDIQLSMTIPPQKVKLKALQNRISEVNKDIRESLAPELAKPLINVPFILKKNYPECRR